MVFANKKLFKSQNGEIHVGINAPVGFSECSIEDIKKVLNNLGNKKIWRCHVCNDLSVSDKPIEVCPTCAQKDAYVQINPIEFKKFLQI
jgi:hypothetical protein